MSELFTAFICCLSANCLLFRLNCWRISAAVRAVLLVFSLLTPGRFQAKCRLSIARTPTGFLLPVASLFDKLSSRKTRSFCAMSQLFVLSFFSFVPQSYIVSLLIPVNKLKPIIPVSYTHLTLPTIA